MPGRGGRGGSVEVSVRADLDVAVEDERLHVDGYGDLLVIEAPSFAAVRALGRGVRALPEPLSTALLAADGPTLDVRVRGVSVARVDAATPAGPVAALLGTAPARPSLVGVVRAHLRH